MRLLKIGKRWPRFTALLAGTVGRLTMSLAMVAGVVGPAGAETPKKIDFGEPAPQWLRESETYALGYYPNDWDALAQSKVKFITHCPINCEFFARCHALGIRCFPYVTLYQAYASESYENVNLREHPEFIEIDVHGNVKRTGFWESEDSKNMYTTCPNVAGYQDAMVAWVGDIMELGADGVFIDNVSNRAPCYGPKFGKHKHLVKDQNRAYALLLKRIREVIKHYQSDGALIANSASPLDMPAEFWKYIDADMLESYICTWVSTERLNDWRTHWHAQGLKLQSYLGAGKQVQALSYLGHTPYGVKEDALFCYASARLAGFVWSGGVSLAAYPDVAFLSRLRLGKPLHNEVEDKGVYWRAFESGLVAVNPDRKRDGFVTVRPPIPTTRFCDSSGSTAEHWAPQGANGYRVDALEKHGGAHSICCFNATATGASGLAQTVELNQIRPVPIAIGGWSKAQDASGRADNNYAIYLDILYQDGTPLHGQLAPFACGTHDWQFSSVTITPVKPIKGLTYNVLFRNKSGKVWFDDMSLKVLDDPTNPRELLQNGPFEELDSRGSIIDVAKTGKLFVPAYSGRVFLYASATSDELTKTGPRLTVVTQPGLGEVRFRVDGFSYWTHSGRWTTEYVAGPEFGQFSIIFEKPGKHALEVVDVIPADMKTPAGYSKVDRLGQFMDPSQPTKPAAGRKFHFRRWTGAVTSDQPRIEIDVAKDTQITAQFDVQK